MATAIVSVTQLVMMTTVQTTLSAPAQEGQSYVIRQIPNDTRLTQALMLRANGFDEVRLDGTVAGGAGAGAVDAILVELKDTESVVRRAVGYITDDTCCAFQFEPITESAGRRFRLELAVRDLPPGVTLALPAVLKEARGDLRINDRDTRADLQIHVSAQSGTALGRLERADPLTRRAIPALFLAVSVATGFAVFALLRTFGGSTS